MELAWVVGLTAAFIVLIIIASYVSRPKNRQAADLATGSNKPDKRNAYGPEAGR